MDIHKQLKAIRKGAGVSQVKLAALSKSQQKQISNIENGADCYLSTMRSFLNALGYDLSAIPIDKK